VRIGGLIRTFKRHKSKKGDPMAFLTVEDIFEAVEVVVFPEAYSRCAEILETTEPVVIQGTIQKEERGIKIIADAVDLLPAAREKYTDTMRLRLEPDRINRPKLEAIKKILLQFHGPCPVMLTLHFPHKGEVDIEVEKDMTIRPCRELTDRIDEALGYRACSFTRKDIVPPPPRRKWGNGGGNGSAKAA